MRGTYGWPIPPSSFLFACLVLLYLGGGSLVVWLAWFDCRFGLVLVLEAGSLYIVLTILEFTM